MIVEPLVDRTILLWVQVHTNGLDSLNIGNVIPVIQRGFFIIKGRKAHSLKMTAITLFPTHSDPHGAPLSQEDGLNDPGDLIDKGDGTGKVVKDLDLPSLLPGHGHILEELEDGMRNVLEGPEVDALIMTKFPSRHVTMILDDFSKMLWGKGFLGMFHKSKPPLGSVALLIHLSPFSRLFS